MSHRSRLWSAALGPVRRAAEMRARLGRRSRQTTVEELDGIAIVVLPDVYNPVTNRTGAMLARVLRDAIPVRPPGEPVPRLLDVGTGCGVAAVFAALRGAEVVAVDLNPEAIRNARLNAQLHHVEHRVDVRQGDLFEPVAGERFDVVAFDPPRHVGRPSTFIDLAWEGEDVLERFAATVGDVLAPGGRVLVSTRTDSASHTLADTLGFAGFDVRVVTEGRFYGATESIVEAVQRQA
ncbi:MAG: polypeptide subunit release factor methylase [Myxococcota bacterium]|jgi:methylase of polypeptide subunit release factors